VPGLAILVSDVLVLTRGQTDRITDKITEADDRYAHETIVGFSKARFPLPELTARVDGPSTRPVETRASQHGPWPPVDR